jgi:hypothetical protein
MRKRSCFPNKKMLTPTIKTHFLRPSLSACLSSDVIGHVMTFLSHDIEQSLILEGVDTHFRAVVNKTRQITTKSKFMHWFQTVSWAGHQKRTNCKRSTEKMLIENYPFVQDFLLHIKKVDGWSSTEKIYYLYDKESVGESIWKHYNTCAYKLIITTQGVRPIRSSN